MRLLVVETRHSLGYIVGEELVFERGLLAQENWYVGVRPADQSGTHGRMMTRLHRVDRWDLRGIWR